MAQQPSLQQLNIEHFNKHSHEDKPHMVALADRTAEHLAKQLPLTRDAVALEFGCGAGLLSERIAPKVGSLYGTDVAGNAVEAYNHRAQVKGLTNMHGVCLDLVNSNQRQEAITKGNLPASFDLIIAHMVLHHVEDEAAVVACLAQLLRPAGRLVLTDLFQTEHSKHFHGAHVHHTVSHPGGFSKEQIRHVVQASGLELMHFDTTSVYVTKTVPQSDSSGDASEDFPILVAVARTA